MLARTLANPSAFPTILHSKGRITYLPSFSEILEDHIILLTCTSPLIAIALQKGTSIAYPILWRRQIQLCLNTVRRAECHLSQESSPTSPWLATLGRDSEKPNNRSKTQEQQTQPASTSVRRIVFFYYTQQPQAALTAHIHKSVPSCQQIPNRLLWKYFIEVLIYLQLPAEVFKRVGRLISDGEANKPGQSTSKDLPHTVRQKRMPECDLLAMTGGTHTSDRTSYWPRLAEWQHNLAFTVVDEAQQFGTDREVTAIAMLPPTSFILWTGDAQQTPGGIAKGDTQFARSRQQLMSRRIHKH